MASLLAQARNNRDLPVAFLRSVVAARKSKSLFDDVETYCMFIGYPRSGHSLAGSLLDAHSETVIAHELDALRYFRVGFSRDQVYALLLENARQYAEAGRVSGSYHYTVPSQWQGRFERLRVIGDKKGGRSTRRMLATPGLIGRVRRAVGVRIRFVHVTRNPYDNIATMFAKKSAGVTLAATVDEYFGLCAGVADTKRTAGDGEVLDLRHESLIADPQATLTTLCSFLDLEADEAYVKDCASILFSSPKKTREKVEWSPELVERVQERMEGFSFLEGYSFES